MEDYIIRRMNNSEWGITAQTERAQNRNPGGIKIGHTLGFKGLGRDIYEYIEVAEAAGFTFAGKELIARERNTTHP